MFKKLANLQKRLDYYRTPVQTCLEPYQEQLHQIKEYHFDAASPEELRKVSQKLKQQACNGVPLETLVPEGYALVRETAKRVLGLCPFDVQILAGLAIHQGKIVEMLTGEGKTLAAVFPAFVHALTGRGVHVLTFNDYLAKRDALWMGSLFDFLGLTVGFVQNGMSAAERKKAYSCDITYLTAKEAGFDHLRSYLCYDPSELVQRPFHFAIIDEADSILIDEGRVPLVIAGSDSGPVERSGFLTDMIRNMKPEIDYQFDEERRNVFLTEQGITHAEITLKCGNLYTPENLPLLASLNNALHAGVLLRRDVDYIVRDNRVELVDEFTGRIMENRHWPEGLQEAVEAKENVPRQERGRILGQMTMRHFIECYPKIAGMTGTAQAAVDELKEFYNLDVVVIPPNRANIRVDEPDVVFTHREAKVRALIEEISTVHRTGRPILVGTGSVAESEVIAELLNEKGIPHRPLNAKNDELEAGIIAEAGVVNAVIISTNMAGRGTDIRLGGADEREYQRIVNLGGLYVIGTQHFESGRIDNQLRGRAGRQGDPGSTRFFISLEDDLIEQYGVKDILPKKYYGLKQDGPIADPAVNRMIESTQRIIEAQNHAIRRNLWKYSWIVEKERCIIQEWRQKILLDEITPDLFRVKLPQRYHELAETLGESVVKRAEKQVILYQIDQKWAEFLEDAAAVREGIHLVSLEGKVPLDAFHSIVLELIRDMKMAIERETVAVLQGIHISAKGITGQGLQRPAATWTYLLNDTPFEKNMKGLLKPL